MFGSAAVISGGWHALGYPAEWVTDESELEELERHLNTHWGKA